jgi:hypothetical protein
VDFSERPHPCRHHPRPPALFKRGGWPSLCHNNRMRFHLPRLPVTAFYILLTAAAYGAYYYLQRFPQSVGIVTSSDLWMTKGSVFQGISSVWFIFAWGFGLQSLIQIVRVFKRDPREASLSQLLRHGAIMSANAGFFEEVIFRLYAFLSFIILMRLVNDHVSGALQAAATHVILPAANFITFGVFQPQFSNWATGLAVIAGSLFFRSAHVHYGKFSKFNVWVIGLVMFWLTFHYGLITAIAAHFLYDLCVFTAIALTAPLQPRPWAVA